MTGRTGVWSAVLAGGLVVGLIVGCSSTGMAKKTPEQIVEERQQLMKDHCAARKHVQDQLKAGTLVELMPAHPIPTFWMKVLVPRIKMNKPAVAELVTFLKSRMQPAPQWEVT